VFAETDLILLDNLRSVDVHIKH